MPSLIKLKEQLKSIIDEELREEERGVNKSDSVFIILCRKYDNNTSKKNEYQGPRINYLIDYETNVSILEKDIQEFFKNNTLDKDKETFLDNLISKIGETKLDDFYNIPDEMTQVIEELNGQSILKFDINKIKQEIEGFKKDPNNDIRFNLQKLGWLTRVATNKELKPLLQKNKRLQTKLETKIRDTLDIIYKESFRPLKNNWGLGKRVGFYTTPDGEVGYSKEAFLRRNSIYFSNIYKKDEFLKQIINKFIIEKEGLGGLFEKYCDLKQRDYLDTVGISTCFDKEKAESMISHYSGSMTLKEIERFFEERENGGVYERPERMKEYPLAPKVMNPVTKSLIKLADLDKDACVFIIKKLASIKDTSSIDFLFKNEKIIKTGALSNALKQILENIPIEFKRSPELLQKILEHINVFNETQTEEIMSIIKRITLNLIEKNTNPNLIALLIKNIPSISCKSPSNNYNK